MRAFVDTKEKGSGWLLEIMQKVCFFIEKKGKEKGRKEERYTQQWVL